MKIYQFFWILGTLMLILSNVTESNIAELSYTIAGLTIFVGAAFLTYQEFK